MEVNGRRADNRAAMASKPENPSAITDDGQAGSSFQATVTQRSRLPPLFAEGNSKGTSSGTKPTGGNGFAQFAVPQSAGLSPKPGWVCRYLVFHMHSHW